MRENTARILSFGLSDVGKKRANNEDAYLLDDEQNLYIVADGMGGHQAGEIASSLAVKTIYETLRARSGEAPVHEALPRAVKLASATIFHAAQEKPDLHGMGTTVTGLSFEHDRADPIMACLAHVGDSRAYLLRGEQIEQLSSDHTWVAEQVREGLITPAQAARSPFRHVIARSVGFEEDVDVDTRIFPVREGDILVLCSDGLSNLLSPEEIQDTVLEGFLRDGPRRLVKLANERGGDDNITVLVVYVNAV
jgi:protein phosphatase